MASSGDSGREGTEERAVEHGGRMSRRDRPGRKGQRARRSQWDAQISGGDQAKPHVLNN